MRRRGVRGALLAAACLLAAAVALPAAAPTLDRARSRIAFVSHQMGSAVSGAFEHFDADVRFDPAAPEQGHFRVDVDLASVQMPTADAVRELAKADWFDVARARHAEFVSSAVHRVDRSHLEVEGVLRLKGRERPLRVPVELVRVGELTHAHGRLQVHRLEFGIGAGEWADTSMVADEVEVDFELVLAGVGPL